MRAVVVVGAALLALVGLAALVTGRRAGRGSPGETERVTTALLRALLVLASFVLVVLVVVVLSD